MAYTSDAQTKTTERPLPKGWQRVKLGEVGKFDSGGTPSKSEEKYWAGGNIPFVTGADISDLYVGVKNARSFLTRAGLESGKTCICKPGMILFVTRTGVGRIGIASELMGASQDLSPYTCGEQIFPEFACRYLQSISDYLIENCRGSTIQGLTKDFIESLEIPLPPLDEQRRIASRLNEQLAAVESARKAAEEQLQAAHQLPSAYLRTIFDNGKLQKWSRRKLGEVCEIIARQVDPKIPEYGALPHVNGENIESGTCQLLYLNSATDEGMKSGKYLFDAGDVLYSKLRPYLRKVTVADFKGVCSADMYPIKVDQEVLDFSLRRVHEICR
jgi:type I restriction enzyme S subunit